MLTGLYCSDSRPNFGLGLSILVRDTKNTLKTKGPYKMNNEKRTA